MSLPFLTPDSTSFEITLWLAAVGGSLFFFLRVMMVLVMGFADDIDIGVDDVDFDDSSGDAAHTEAAFKLFSLNTISAFVMMFGWSGLTAYLQFQLPSFAAILIALVVGFFAMYVTAWMYKAAARLASAGADFKISEAVGLRGTVYQEIPATGVGKIQVTVNEMLHELQASSDNGSSIDSFSTVEVVGIANGDTVTVKEISIEKENV